MGGFSGLHSAPRASNWFSRETVGREVLWVTKVRFMKCSAVLSG